MKTEVHLAELVQENGSAVGFLEKTFLVFVSSGKGARNVAKHFALEEFLPKGRTVDDYEGLTATLTRIVDGIREHLFTRTGRSVEQHGSIGWRHLLGEVLRSF